MAAAVESLAEITAALPISWTADLGHYKSGWRGGTHGEQTQPGSVTMWSTLTGDSVSLALTPQNYLSLKAVTETSHWTTRPSFFALHPTCQQGELPTCTQERN